MADGSEKKTRVGAGVGPPPGPAPEVPSAQPSGDALAANLPAAGMPAYVAPPDPLLGAVLAGRYHIEKKLGEGGMGAVYLAKHVTLEKQVALKVLHAEFARKPDLVERFLQEAKSASRIRHENVIDITDFGTTTEGVVFFAMELLSGHDLHDAIARARLAGGRLPWERAQPIFLQICAALTAAHNQGIVHRDLKPENIYLVEWAGHRDFVKLLDFGIAKMTEVSENDRKLTRTGMLFGTPEYMSPEQARGEQVDHRVDVYAMGCILHQLIAGRAPFEADNFMSVLSLHLTEEPPRLDPAAVAATGAPPGVQAVILRALAKDRDARYPRIADLAAAIRALSVDDGGVAATPSPSPRSAPASAASTVTALAIAPRRTSWGLIIGGLLVVAGLAVGAVVLLGRDRGEHAAPDPAKPGSQFDPATVGPGGAAVTPGGAAVTPGGAPAASVDAGAGVPTASTPPSGDRAGSAKLPGGDRAGSAKLPGGDRAGSAKLPGGDRAGSSSKPPDGDRVGSSKPPDGDQAGDHAGDHAAPTPGSGTGSPSGDGDVGPPALKNPFGSGPRTDAPPPSPPPP